MPSICEEVEDLSYHVCREVNWFNYFRELWAISIKTKQTSTSGPNNPTPKEIPQNPFT